MRPAHRALFFALYLLVTVTVICTILEIAARVRHQAPPLDNQWAENVSDPHLPYRPRPHAQMRGRSATGEFEYEYVQNAEGFRDVDHVLAKPPGSFRIVGLGDSFTYGAGAPYDSTYLARLEVNLNARPGNHPHVEIVKMGIGRYFPEPERLLLQYYGLAYQPDLVLVGFLPNDLIDTFLGLGAVAVDPSGYLVSKDAARLGRVGTWLYVHSHYCRVMLAKTLQRKRLAEPPGDGSKIYEDGGLHEADWLTIEAEYSRMKQLCDAHGARLAIVHIPQAPPWTAQHDYPAIRLRRWAAARDVLVIDALPALQEAAAGAARLYYEQDGHCTPAGYRVLAQAIQSGLEAAGAVP